MARRGINLLPFNQQRVRHPAPVEQLKPFNRISSETTDLQSKDRTRAATGMPSPGTSGRRSAHGQTRPPRGAKHSDRRRLPGSEAAAGRGPMPAGRVGTCGSMA